MTLKRIFALALLTILLGVPALISAQSINGTISGTVVDQQSAVVAGANVTATNAETGAARNVTTNDEGTFTIAALPVGVYTVRTEKSGFSATIRENVQVSVAANTQIEVQLGVGQAEARVDVTSAGELLDTQQSQVSKIVDQQRILELPGRNSLNGLALLNPGVLPNQNGRPGSGFAVNGNRTRSNNFTIDGANNNDQSLSIPRQNLPPEALQEFQIITNTFAAEYGRNAGSYVNQITRSGTNQFSGAAFYNYSGNSLNALTTTQERNFRSNVANGQSEYVALRNARNVNVNNTYGFTFGGPVVKNHTFFFTSLDFNDDRFTIGSSTRSALNPASVANLELLRTPANSARIDFLLNTFPRAQPGSASFGSTTVLGQSLNFLTFNRGAAGGLAYGNDFNRFLGKVNTRINKKDQLSFRYLIDSLNDPGQPVSLVGLELGARNRNDSFTINDVFTITSNIINEARFTYSYRRIVPIENFLAFAGGAQLQINGVPGSAFNGGNANYPQNRTDKVFEITDNVTYLRGNHTFKVGYNLLRYNLNNFFAPNSRGTVIYGSLTDYVNDTNATVQKANGDFRLNAVTYENGLFVQDDYKFSTDLTLNLGLRYEYVTTPLGFFSNAKSDINNFGPRVGFAYNPKGLFGGKMVVRGGFAISYDQVFQNILLNVSRNYPRVVNNSVTNCTGCQAFLGFANIPLTATATNQGLTAPGAVRAFFARDPSTVDAAQIPFIDQRLFSPNERIRQPQSIQTTLGVQYQLGNDYVIKAEYIRTKGNNLVREVEQNYSFSNATLAAQIGRAANQRLDPTRGSVLVGQGIANSIYHAAQFTFEKRLSNLNVFGNNFGQFTFNANYSYSSFISESDDILGGQANRTIASDPRNARLDRARSGFDQPHRFVFSGVFVSPEVFKENGILNRLLSGYQISFVHTAATGIPFSILASNNAAGIGSSQITTVQLSQRVGLNNPNGAPNSYTTALVRNGQVISLGARPDAKYVLYTSADPANPALCASTPTAANCATSSTGVGIFGNLGANSERTPSTYNTDFALVKNVRTFGERQRLQLRAEIFNAFNRRNFTVVPTNTLAPAAFTTDTSTAAGQAQRAAFFDPNTFNNINFLNYSLTNVGGRTFNFGARYFF